MTDAGRALVRTAFAMVLAACGLPQAALACGDHEEVRYYFQRQPPEETPDIMFVRVTIVSRAGKSVEARLDGRFARLSADGKIHIVLPYAPSATNCIELGEIKGPVYVVASSALVQNGHASIMAEPMGTPGPSEVALRRAARKELQRVRRGADVTYPGLSNQ